MELTSHNVHEIVNACLYTDDEVAAGHADCAIKVEGITMNIGFHPGRISEHADTILKMLMDLPDSFRGSDGDSFLNACMTRNGRHWGEHQDMQALMMLGVAADLVWVLPRFMWCICPGMMPVFGLKSVALKSERH